MNIWLCPQRPLLRYDTYVVSPPLTSTSYSPPVLSRTLRHLLTIMSILIWFRAARWRTSSIRLLVIKTIQSNAQARAGGYATQSWPTGIIISCASRTWTWRSNSNGPMRWRCLYGTPFTLCTGGLRTATANEIKYTSV